MKIRKLYVLCAALALSAVGQAWAKPPMEAFSDLPGIRAAELSPDGKRVAFLQRIAGEDYLAMYSFETQTTKALLRAAQLRARALEFVGNDHVLLIASKTTKQLGFRGRFEMSAAFSYNITTGKFVQLLSNTNGLFPAQSGIGNIVGVDPDGLHVYMPAFTNESMQSPPLELFKVNLDTGRGTPVGRGASHATIDWITDGKGAILVREDFSEKRQEHSIRAFASRNDREIFSSQGAALGISLVGVSSKGDRLVVGDEGDTDFFSLREMALADGELKGTILQREDAEVQGVLTDSNRVVYGVRFSGMYPSYEMFDADLNRDMKAVVNRFPTSAVFVDSWSADWSKVLLLVEGGAKASRYVVFDRSAKTLKEVSYARPSIKEEDVGEVVTIEFKARDGLKINGLITWPTGIPADQRKNLPFIVMPHGGPAAYDSVGFDWLAQFLANEGYAIVQPNFRGSAGFGASFREAGYGEWGRKMQDDVTDAANAMVRMGWADPARMCIVGASYGGYAALAGATLTPDQYKCAVSIAGVGDLRDMLASERRENGRQSLAYSYWLKLIGNPDKDREGIDAVSPIKLVDRVKMPVLLMHGADDLTVPIRQSERMNQALKAAGKQVEFVRIKGDDHYLVSNESRRVVLTKLQEFLAAHIGKPN